MKALRGGAPAQGIGITEPIHKHLLARTLQMADLCSAYDGSPGYTRFAHALDNA
jgi:hypothetical protein